MRLGPPSMKQQEGFSHYSIPTYSIMAPSSSRGNATGGKKKRLPTREAAYNHNKTQAKKQREKLAFANSSTTSSANAASQKVPKRAAAGSRKTKVVERDAHPFRYKSFNKRLEDIRIDMGRSGGSSTTLSGLDALSAAQQAGSTSTDALSCTTVFGQALEAWKELNLSLPFVDFSYKASPISTSLPLLLHHRDQLCELLCGLLTSRTSDAHLAYITALDLIPRLAADLASEFLPIYPVCLDAVLSVTFVTQKNTLGDGIEAARIVEKAFESCAVMLRSLSGHILGIDAQDATFKGKQQANGKSVEPTADLLTQTWSIIRPLLGWRESKATRDDQTQVCTRTIRSAPAHTRRFASEAFAHLVRRSPVARLADIAQTMLADVATMMQHAQSGASHEREKHRDLAKGVAGVWVEVLKSVDRKLHSQTPALLACLLRSDVPTNVGTEDQYFWKARSTVGTLTLTALSHHTQRQYAIEMVRSLVDVACVQLEGVREGMEEDRWLALGDSLTWLTIVIGTRKGSRVDDSLKPHLFEAIKRASKTLSNVGNLANPIIEEAVRAMTRFVIVGIICGGLQERGGCMMALGALAPSSFSADDSLNPIFCTVATSLSHPTLEWDFFRHIGLPSIQTVTTSALATLPEELTFAASSLEAGTLHLLSALHSNGQLETKDAAPSLAAVRWTNAATAVVRRRLLAFADQLESAERFNDHDIRAVELSALVLNSRTANGTAIQPLCSIILAILRSAPLASADSARTHYEQAGPYNALTLLGTALASLHTVLSGSTTLVESDRTALQSLTIKGELTAGLAATIISNYPWHRTVLPALANLTHSASSFNILGKGDFPTLEAASEQLISLTMSTDSVLRSAALELLVVCEQQTGGQPPSASPDSILARMKQINSIACSVEMIRDRNVRTRALARELLRLHSLSCSVESGSDRATLSIWRRATISFLIGTCKLNFKPIWAESIKALVDLAAQFGDEVWSITFGEAKRVVELGGKIDVGVMEAVPSSWGSSELGADGIRGLDEKLDEVAGEKDDNRDADAMHADRDEDERHFRDPQLAERFRVIQTYEVSFRSSAAAKPPMSLDLADAQRLDGRLDTINYEAQVLNLIGCIPRVAEKHNSDFVLFFLETVPYQPDDEDEVAGDEDAEEGDEAEESLEVSAPRSSSRFTVSERRSRLCSYLDVFSKFTNPKAVVRSSELHCYFLDLCALGDEKVQRKALDCILTWKNASQTPYADHLRSLLDPAKFRDELSSFTFAAEREDAMIVDAVAGEPQQEGIQPAHRQDLTPLLLRLLFGQMVSRRGRNTSGAGQQARKTAILTALDGCTSEELRVLVDLMLEPFTASEESDGSPAQMRLHERVVKTSLRRQNGFLNLLGDVIKHLGLILLPHWPRFIRVVLNMMNEANNVALTTSGPASAPARGIRQLGYKRLGDFFRQPTTFNWDPFLPALFEHLVSPRLPLLRVESAQSPSALLDLMHIWSARTDTMMLLVSGDDKLLPHVYAVLAAPSVKPMVIARILDIAERIMTAAAENQEIQRRLVAPYVSEFLASVSPLVAQTTSASGVQGATQARSDQLKREISLLSSVAPFVSSSADAQKLLILLSPMLSKSGKLVPEKTKVELLSIFGALLQLSPDFQDPTSQIFESHYVLFSGMFATLRSRSARLALVAAFAQFAKIDTSLTQIKKWTEDLNAFSSKRLEEPDFDKRLAAFAQINSDNDGSVVATLSMREWLPILHNMLYMLQDEEELVFRTNAATTLRLFNEVVTSVFNAQSDDAKQKRESLVRVVYPGLRGALRSRSELVRREVLGVLANAVLRLPEFGIFEGMKGLLADGDEEASFFNNVYHIQVHRRTRALRRLADEVEKGVLKSKVIAEIFVPLLGHFLEPSGGSAPDGNLVTETISCLSRLSRHLGWSAYNSVLWRYLRLANEKSTNEKIFVRTAMGVLDGFHFGMDDTALVPVDHHRPAAAVEVTDSTRDPEAVGDGAAVPDADEGDDNAAAVEADERVSRPTAQPRALKVLDAVTQRLLPSLMKYLDQKDETEDAVRLPIAVGVVKVAKCLPEHVRETHIRKLLITLANVLKSKAQDTRDLARETLWKVSQALGPTYFAAIVKELKRALSRGPQLAVCAYTAHALLVHMMTASDQPLTALEHGIVDLMEIITEDVFGQTMEDREAPEYRSKMREVRQQKSMDTLEQAAKIVVPHRMSVMLTPLRDIMQQTETHRIMRSVDDALRHISAGFIHNTQFDAAALLVLCHSLITRHSAFLQPKKTVVKGKHANQATIVLLKRKDVESQSAAGRDHYARNAHRFVSFGLDLLVTALRRGRFDYQDSEILSRLDPMVAAVANTLYATEASVVILGLKALTAMLRTPLPSLGESLPVLTKQIFTIIRKGGSLESEVVQTALKTLTAILRECREVEVKEKDLAELLTLIMPDLEEPASQSALFGLLRSIVFRRFVVPEVYDVMDRVAEMLVTNQGAQVRELCRATYLQFLLDYPQGKARLRNQMSFLAKNLSYTFESGRLSVMELLSAIFSKFGDEVLRDHSDLFYVALVIVLANDDSTKCRETAATLIRTLVCLLQAGPRDKAVQMTHAWVEQRDRLELARVGLQVYGILLDADPESSVIWLPRAIANMSSVLAERADALETLEQGEEELSFLEEALREEDLDWQLPYHALQTLAKVYRMDESMLKSTHAASTWTSTYRLLLFPHKWVRIASCRLVGTFFASAPISKPLSRPSDADSDPLCLESLVNTAKKFALQLRSPVLDESLSLQIVKNLLHIGKVFALVDVRQEQISDYANAEDPESDDEDVKNATVTAESIDRDRGAFENPLVWLFTKLSFQARSAHIAHNHAKNVEGTWTTQPASVLRWFAAMTTYLEPPRVEQLLLHIINPLYRFQEDTTIKSSEMEDLKVLAAEVQELVQNTVGSTRFAAAYQIVRQRAVDRRRDRKTARLMQGIANPEAAQRDRVKRNEAKHASRKRKAAAYADTKVRTKPLKRHRG